MSGLKELYIKINYTFKNEEWVKRALTHPSLSNKKNSYSEKVCNYERLEFLGDAVLSLVISEYLVKTYLKETEGKLSKRRAALVCSECLSQVAEKLDLGSYIDMSIGEETGGGRMNQHNLENVLEALVGAIYLDGGLIEVEKFIMKNWQCFLDDSEFLPREFKSKLQEWAQKNKKDLPLYTLKKQEGSEHEPVFYVELFVEGLPLIVEKGASKKEAETRCAEVILSKIF